MPIDKKGYIAVICGEGKGKTTSMIGQAVRAAGKGLRTCIIQFLKDTNTGEYQSISRYMPHINLYVCGPDGKITFNRNKDPRDGLLAQRGWEFVKDNSPNYDVMILDEFLTTLDFEGGLKFIPVKEVTDWLDNKPLLPYVFMSGVYVPEEIKERAGLISRIEQEKHWFPKVLARQGIEF